MNHACVVNDGGSANDLVARFAERYGFREEELLNTLAQTAFRQQNGSVPSREQMLSLLAVADSYGLNPFIRQIWALSDRKGGVLPVISVDGWVCIMNSYPESDGVEFSYPDELIQFDEDMKPCHPWIECTVHRKDREHAIRVREYLDELYRPVVIKNGKKFPGPWQTCPKRMLRHRCQIQGIRIAYGLSGLFEPDEAERILETQLGEPVPNLKDSEEKAVEGTWESGRSEQEVGAEKADQSIAKALEAEVIDRNDRLDMVCPDASDLDPEILTFIDQVVDRARATGAYTAAQGFVQERFKGDGNAINYCLFRLDEAQAASAMPAA